MRPFADYLGTYRTHVIAECKKASPSRGVLSDNYHPGELADVYANCGASAISVLTDEKFFQGSMNNLAAVRERVDLPVLRKDFTIDEQDLLEARAGGADIVLLIARVLGLDGLKRLVRLCHDLGMDSLVEVHSETEVDEALRAAAPLIGINNRDLATFEIDLALTEKLMENIPSQIPVVSESGISTSADVIRLRDRGVRAVLVGEALIRAADTGELLRELVEAGCPDCRPSDAQPSSQPTN